MSIKLVSHVSVSQSVATSNIDTTGATLLVAAISNNGTPSVVDNKANTWVPLTNRVGPSRNNLQLFYAWKPKVGTGHNFTPNASAGSTAIAAFSGIETSVNPFLSENGGSTAAADTGASAGVLSPMLGQDTLIVTAFGIDDPAGNIIACAGFTITDTIDVIVGSQYGISFAFQVQEIGALVNPAWTRSNANTQLGDAFADAAFLGVRSMQGQAVAPTLR